jgi:hydroxyethylthiazole kinase-like uncharacterized protein yjeF
MPSPILSVAQMRSWEQATWQTGIAEQTVIARVGEIVARRALAMSNDSALCLALAGKGHNGDDVRLSVPHLTGRDVQLLEIADPSRQLPELARALERRPALIIDGLFGIGLNRPLDEDWKAFIDRINRSQVPVLAVDCPSGLNCETGKTEGAAIVAQVTLTLGAVKRGLIATSAAPYVGRLELASEIGLVPCPVETDLQWTVPDDFAGLPPPRKRDAHKGAFGHLVIVAGSLGYHGAAVLAARGAQAAQPGLITVVTTDEAFPPVAAQLQSAMVRPWTADWEPPEKTTAVLFGPGLADPTVPTGLRKQMVHLWQEFDGAIVADASGIDWLAGAGLHSRAPRVITPHPGEAAKLLNTDTKGIQADRVAAVRKLSTRVGGALVVLKGYQTLVGGEDGPVHVNNTGGPLLGQGGSGDVLAGYLAGLLAQPAMSRDPVRTTRHAVWRHGLAGEAERWNGMIDELPVQLAQLERD